MRKTRFTLLAIMLFISMLAPAQEEKKFDWVPKVSGFAQFRFDANFDNDFKLMNDSFRFHRVCLSLSGNLTEKLSWVISGDFVRQPMLVNAIVKYDFCDAFAIQAGQFKTPFTIENELNPAFGCEIFDYGSAIKELVGYEYSYISPLGALGCDIGVMASGKLANNVIEYKAGIFNGNGINNVDNNNNKIFVGRLDFHPIKSLTFSGSIRNGNYYCDTINKGVFNRWSIGAQFKNDRLVVRSEYIGAETGKEIQYPSHVYQTTTVNEHVKNYSFYAVAGYWFKICKGKQKIMPVVRYDRVGEGKAFNEDTVSYYTAGIYYLPIPQFNFKLDYQYITWGNSKEDHHIVAILNYRF